MVQVHAGEDLVTGMTEREWDKRLHIKTIGREDEANPNYSPYEPTPYSVLQRLADSGYIKRRNHLLDYGCGKGRVAFFMASVVGCRVTGIDYSQKLIGIAKENRRAASLGDRVTLSCCRAEQYDIEDEDVFFFFNPFSEKVFEGVLRRLRRSRRENPQAMIVICYYPSESYTELLDGADDMRKIDDINCNDLFSGKANLRERIVVYRFID